MYIQICTYQYVYLVNTCDEIVKPHSAVKGSCLVQRIRSRSLSNLVHGRKKKCALV